MSINPINQSQKLNGALNPALAPLPNPEKLKLQLKTEKGPSEAALIIYHKLSNKNLSMQSKNLSAITSLLISCASLDEPSKKNIRQLLLLLPENQRAMIIGQLRNAENKQLADYFLENQGNKMLQNRSTLFTAALGSDTNKNGVLDPKDAGIKAAYDLNEDGQIDYSELAILKPELSDELADSLSISIMSRMERGIVIQSDLDQMEKLSVTSNSAKQQLANIKAHVLSRQGKFREALLEYKNCPVKMDENRNFLYGQLKKYEKKLALLENLRSFWPEIIKNQSAIFPRLDQVGRQSISSALTDFSTLANCVFSYPDIFTNESIEAMLKFLPREATALKNQLKEIINSPKPEHLWQATLDGKSLISESGISKADLSRQIEINVPKGKGNSQYYFKVKMGKQYVPIEHDLEPEENLENPLYLKLRIPAWRLLQDAAPLETFTLEICSRDSNSLSGADKDKTLKTFSITRNEEKSVKAVKNVPFQDYLNSLAGRINRDNHTLNFSYVIVSHFDNPHLKYQQPKFRILERALALLNGSPELFPELSETEKTDLKNKLTSAIHSKSREVLIDEKHQKVGQRLLALQDLYFSTAYRTLLKDGWKITGKEEPKTEVSENSRNQKIITSSRIKIQLEKRIRTSDLPPSPLRSALEKSGQKEAVIKLEVSYYTDTNSGYYALQEKLADEKYSAVSLQGHRLNLESLKPSLSRFKADHPGFTGRKTPVAYFGNHCTSARTTELLAARIGNLHAPIATTSEIYPAAKVNTAFYKSIMQNQEFQPKDAGQAYNEANNSKKGNFAYSKLSGSMYDPLKDTDNDGFPDFIDPAAGRNRPVFDNDKEELKIVDETGKTSATLPKYRKEDLSALKSALDRT